MLTENDLEFIGDFDLKKEEYREFLSFLEDFDWEKDSLDRKDGLALNGKSKVIFYDHFWVGELSPDFKEIYEDKLDKDSEKLRSLSLPILRDILKFFPKSTYVKGEISCCFPSSEQTFHIDPRVFHKYSKRIHLPLLSNEQSFLDIEDKSFHLDRGKLYEFNNMKRHRSKNLGNTIRVHIILDIISLLILTQCQKLLGKNFYKSVIYTDQKI
jgi:hypothetical protein